MLLEGLSSLAFHSLALWPRPYVSNFIDCEAANGPKLCSVTFSLANKGSLPVEFHRKSP